MDLATTLSSLSPGFGLVCCLLAHVLVSRAAPALPRHHGLAAGILTGLGAVLAMALAYVGRQTGELPVTNRWGAAAVWLLTYVALAYCYVFGFFNLGESARRIRLLVELEAAGSRGLTIEEILTAYNARLIVEARLERLLTGGQVVERGGRYFSKRSPMLFIAKSLSFMKVLFLGAPSEFGPRR